MIILSVFVYFFGSSPYFDKQSVRQSRGDPALPLFRCLAYPDSADVKAGIHGVHVFLVQPLPQALDGLAEALEVDDLPLPQEFDHVVHVRVVRETENVVVGHPGLLLCCQILGEIGDGISLDSHGGRRPGEAGGCRGVDSRRVIHEVGGEAGGTDLFLAQRPGQLVDDGADHFQVAQLVNPK